jgi:hypothetical protein
MTALPPGRAGDAKALEVPCWNVSTPYGYGSAVDAGGTIAAPLLAGFSVGLIGVMLPLRDSHGPAPLADIAVVLLATATVTLLACVQCTFWARQYALTPNQIMEWWPDLRAPGAAGDQRWEALRAEQWRYQVLLAIWVGRVRATYSLGIVTLLGGIGLALVPREWNPWHIIALTVIGVGVLAEVAWIVLPSYRKLSIAPRLFPEPRDVAHIDLAQPTPYPGPRPIAPVGE